MLIIGNKYVPHSKKGFYTGNKGLNSSSIWKEAKAKNQPYLYYNGLNEEEHVFGIDTEYDGDYFLESDVTPYVEFILPERWSIRRNQHNYQVINTWMNKHHNVEKDVSVYEDTNGLVNNTNAKKGDSNFPEITFEQFKTHVLKQDTMQKLLGYKFKSNQSELIKAALAIEGNNAFGLASIYSFILKPGINQTSINKLNQAGVLDLWFDKVYEEEFKVGDYVVLTKNPSGWANKELLGTTYKIIADRKQYAGNLMIYTVENMEGNVKGGLDDGCYRLATAQEIENTQNVTISGYKAELEGSVIKFGCQSFNKSTIESLINLKGRTEMTFKCSVNGSDISLETLKKLYAKLT